MVWNYRLIKHDSDPDPARHYLAVHEVFYNEAGEPHSWTADPITFECEIDEGKEAVAKSLAMALEDVRRYEVVSETALLKAMKVEP